MASTKSERLLNLTIALLSTKRYLPKEDIRTAVAGYEDQSPATFERMFERDKDELRALGIPIETGNIDHYFSDEKGYRIPPASFELPPIELDADEAAVLGVAARAWRESSMAAASQSAMRKLRGAGVEPDTSRLTMLDPVVTAREPSFGLWADATRQRVRVRFSYRSSQTRTLEPWAVTSTRGRWYVVGRDVDRDDTRMFRLSRISGTPKIISKPGAYDIPADLDVRALTRSLEPPSTTGTAIVGIRRTKAPMLRRSGHLADLRAADAIGAITLPDGFDVYEVGYSSLTSATEELAALAADVVVLEPSELRELVIGHLIAVAAAYPPGPGQPEQSDRPEQSDLPEQGVAG